MLRGYSKSSSTANSEKWRDDWETDPHDTARPDLFGQAYKVLFEATFHAILEGRTEVGAELFPKVIAMAELARVRLVDDLPTERQHEQVIFGTEPLVDMMELSGYALLMSEVER